MAMNPMQKKARTSFLLGMFLTLVITGIIIILLILQLGNVKKEQAAIVHKQVFVATNAITSGDKVQGKVAIKEIESDAVPNNAVTAANQVNYITEYATSKITIEPGTLLTSDMVNPTGVADSNDVRMQEYNMIILPTALAKGQTVDIRLRLPSGEDYIVISKKYIEQANANTIWLKVREDEILTMSNAIVEAYIMEGSLLYATIYTDAGMQDASIPTYVTKSSVQNLIDADKNIINTAKAALGERYTQEARAQRDNVINNAVNSFADNAAANVQDKVEEEIQKQQNARQAYITSLGVQ